MSKFIALFLPDRPLFMILTKIHSYDEMIGESACFHQETEHNCAKRKEKRQIIFQIVEFSVSLSTICKHTPPYARQRENTLLEKRIATGYKTIQK